MNTDISKLKDSVARLTERTQARINRNKKHLTNLFAGPFPGHAFHFVHEPVNSPGHGDFTLVNERPVSDWLSYVIADYESQLRLLSELDHDGVPYVNLLTNTGVFAAGFGCKMHLFEGSNAAAGPCVETVADAAKLKTPRVEDVPTLMRVIELARLVRDTLGPDVHVTGCDIQSPFDIAALIWRKQDLFVAMIEEPNAVKDLIAKTHELLMNFLVIYTREFPNFNPIHCPWGWVPTELGIGLSEDEAGSLNTEMFEEFSLPSLVEISNLCGGMFLHCCAAADHQYASFQKIPNLRGLNRVYQYPPGPKPAIERFSGKTVFMVAWTDIEEQLAMARPDTRFLMNIDHMPLDDARRKLDEYRARFPRL